MSKAKSTRVQGPIKFLDEGYEGSRNRINEDKNSEVRVGGGDVVIEINWGSSSEIKRLLAN